MKHPLARLDRPLIAAGLLSALVVSSAPAAHAASYDWHSRSKPLKAWEDDVAQALAYGTSYTKDGFLKNHTYYRDPRSGGDKVYTETGYTYREPGQGGESWSGHGSSDQSPRNSSGDWVDQYDKDDYSEHNDASQGRVHSKVCEDQAWSPDACSRRPYFTFAL
ncbi:hypothetical protein LRP67_01045 [Nocardioides sp. cx-169]|uniref:hypothetical protein n=1 Tax=Nocardioides sp. cx-169 TaxID=2899080 RepID=UPI001E3F3AE5|nr:hypothetical protein [Nocardioides sp. cx-169]MCD4532675.1 hypothetical protein [Nocardioides sp. cx-169]